MVNIMLSRLSSRRCRPTPLCHGKYVVRYCNDEGGSLRSQRLRPVPLKGRSRFARSNRRFAYPIADAIVKIGRYIATTINPTVTPKNTIIIGSKRAVRLVTAWSTSSS